MSDALRLQGLAPAKARQYSPTLRNPDLLDADGAAAALGVSRPTFERHLAKQAVPQPAWVGGKRIWRKVDLEAFLAAKALLGRR